MKKFVISLFLLLFCCHSLGAAGIHEQAEAMGASLSAVWVAPFACLLLSIALFPLFAGYFWEHNYGKVAAFWSVVFLVPYAFSFGISQAVYAVVHTFFGEYLSFIILLFALFTIAGGICVKGSLAGTPKVNSLILLVGALLASLMGTTGAAMLLIRPLMRAISHRKHRAHTIVFFIFLVANIGGCLTPLGDPPLFLGFLKGVAFSWTLVHLALPFALMLVALLVIYYFIDSYYYKKEGAPVKENSGEKFGLDGKFNLLLLCGVVVGTLVSGVVNLGSFSVYHVEVSVANCVRDAFFVVLAFVSLKLTASEIRTRNEFGWAPILEVAKLFAGIFVTMVPAIAILKAGSDGALGGLIALVSSGGEANNAMYFWLTGLLSSFLDNAPTYVVFFNTAGGDANFLMSAGATTLLAISMGAVFMGANTYIGNAPNFMVRSIAESGGIKMPSFFGYMKWSVGVLVPLFLVLTFLFFGGF